MINNEWGFITFPTHTDPEQRAIARLKIASEMSLEHYKTPLLLTHSGGKDSCVLTELALRAEIPFEVLHAHTTADAPETVHFVRNEFARLENRGIRCSINYPLYKSRRTSMWDLIPRKLMPPTRVARYCCAVLKEQNGKGRFLATGVRWAESVNRSKRRGIFEKHVSNRDKEVHIRNDEESLDALFAPCRLAAKRFVNPIVDWSNREVWDFLHDARIPVNPLYFCGFSRVGCIGCPMAGKHRYFEFARYPQYEKLYLMAFDRMLEERRRRERIDGSWGKDATAEEVFHWWMEDDFIPGQMSLEEFLYVFSIDLDTGVEKCIASNIVIYNTDSTNLSGFFDNHAIIETSDTRDTSNISHIQYNIDLSTGDCVTNTLQYTVDGDEKNVYILAETSDAFLVRNGVEEKEITVVDNTGVPSSLRASIPQYAFIQKSDYWNGVSAYTPINDAL